MYQHTAAGLYCRNQRSTYKVGGESWPRCISNRKYRPVHKTVYFIHLFCGDVKVVAFLPYLHAQATEHLRNQAQMLQCHITYCYVALSHSSHTYKTANLNHIGQQTMYSAAKAVDTFDCKSVAAYTADACTHLVEHLAQLVDVWLAGGVHYCCRALSHNSSHNNIGRTCNTGLVEQHIPACQPIAGIEPVASILGTSSVFRCRHAQQKVLDLGTEHFHTRQMGVNAAAAYLVTTRLRYNCHTETSQQRTGYHNASAKTRSKRTIFRAANYLQLYVVGLESVALPHSIPGKGLNLDPEQPEKLYQMIHIPDVGHILYHHPLFSQQHGAYHLKSLVLGSLWEYGSPQFVSAFYFKTTHSRLCFS